MPALLLERSCVDRGAVRFLWQKSAASQPDERANVVFPGENYVRIATEPKLSRTYVQLDAGEREAGFVPWWYIGI
ncbi:hypothetical protein ABZP36_020150 [Zizania latifolia]